jgi:hypothetical protein
LSLEQRGKRGSTSSVKVRKWSSKEGVEENLKQENALIGKSLSRLFIRPVSKMYGTLMFCSIVELNVLLRLTEFYQKLRTAVPRFCTAQQSEMPISTTHCRPHKKAKGKPGAVQGALRLQPTSSDTLNESRLSEALVHFLSQLDL